jgi:hypothetical protein
MYKEKKYALETLLASSEKSLSIDVLVKLSGLTSKQTEAHLEKLRKKKEVIREEKDDVVFWTPTKKLETRLQREHLVEQKEDENE